MDNCQNSIYNRTDIAVVDFHSHILPGADHGSDNITMSLAQIDMISACSKTELITATPHFYPMRHSLLHFLHKRERAIAELIREAGNRKNTDKKLTLAVGAEVNLCPGLNNLDGLDELCIEGTKTMLIEMPFVKWTSEVTATVLELAEMGYDIVLAHIDRYDLRETDKLLRCGIGAQINADSLSTTSLRKKMFSYIDKGAVVALGSDLHGSEKKGYDAFIAADGIMGERYMKVMKRTIPYVSGAHIYTI